VRQSHHKHPALHDHPGDRGVKLAEVDFGLSAGQMDLRDRHLMAGQPEFNPAPRHIPRHRDLRARGLMFGDQALPDPSGGVALLTRRIFVGDQPPVDDGGPLVDGRARPPRIHLARRRDRVGEGLAHRPTMCAMTIR
jgi:hypothetical protein